MTSYLVFGVGGVSNELKLEESQWIVVHQKTHCSFKFQHDFGKETKGFSGVKGHAVK